MYQWKKWWARAIVSGLSCQREAVSLGNERVGAGKPGAPFGPLG